MASISERQRKDGSTAYMAQIVIKREGQIVHRENKTFDTKRKATAWAARREEELDQPDALADHDNPKLADVIDQYTTESRKTIGRTKRQVLGTIKKDQLAQMRCSRIASKDLIAFANRIGERAKPQTVSNYLSHLAAVFAIARPAWGYPLDQQAMTDAFAVAKRLGVTGKSKERERRPTMQELEKLMTHFGKVRERRKDSLPMQAIIAFAIYSTRRQEEILRVRWADLDEQHSRLLVRDMKHPDDKAGNHQWLDLTQEALAIIHAQPRAGERIFPYSTDAVSAAFTRAGKFLEIDDLHFHDLRHHGISRLFEIGWSIPKVATVSGHQSWQSLKRYTHIRQSGDCMAGWGWLDQVTKKPGNMTGQLQGAELLSLTR